jgi:hypothetical protein
LASYKADATACQPVKQLAQWLTTSKRLSFMVSATSWKCSYLLRLMYAAEHARH